MVAKACRMIFAGFVFCMVITASLQAQSVREDSIFLQNSLHNTGLVYQQVMGNDLRLFNGVQYAGYHMVFVKGHPYFKTERFENGSLTYDDVYYQNFPLQYDEVSDQLIIQTIAFRIQLSKERVKDFEVFGSKFILGVKDSLNKQSAPKTGFYEVLYPGKTMVLKREEKSIMDELSVSEGILRHIITRYSYYFKVGDNFYPVTKKSDLYAPYPERKKDVRDFIKSNNLNLKKRPEDALKMLADFYDKGTR